MNSVIQNFNFLSLTLMISMVLIIYDLKEEYFQILKTKRI
jgi:hypothetical protein